MKDEELIGKKVYRVSHYGINSMIGTINRVTSTQIIVGSSRFNRETLNPIGYISRSVLDYYKIETPEMNEAWEVKAVIDKISNGLMGAIRNCTKLEEKLNLSDVKQAAHLLGIQL